MIAVISDVHANIPALKSVLRDIRRRGIGAIYSLGDCVGYNSWPGETIALLREERVVSVKGNHDMMACGELPIERCGPNARISQFWTRSALSTKEREYLRALPREMRVEPDIFLMHSRLDDPVGYLLADGDHLDQYRRISTRDPSRKICFTGHTHKSGLVEISPQGMVRRWRGRTAMLYPEHFCFINPGSVGHPRQSDYRASYVIYDPRIRRVEWIRVAYDKEVTRCENLRNGIHTDLGPGVISHAVRRWAERCRAQWGVTP